MYRTNYILLGATHTKRIKKYEPRIVSCFGGKALGQQLVDCVRKNGDMVTVLSGYKVTKVKKLFKGQPVEIVKYDEYETCGMNNAILFALKNSKPSQSVCIMHTDIFIEKFNFNMSENFIAWHENIKDSEVGIKENYGIVEKFSYAENKKWAKIINFDEQTVPLLVKVLEELNHRWLVDTEIYNLLLDAGIFFNTVKVDGFFKEFDSKNDYIDC